MLSTYPIQIWAGMECTTNRVGEHYFHQLDRTGHTERLSDLERFVKLGIKRLRYPVLWERIAPNGLTQADWRWPDERLGRLRELGLPPIVGLLHHGSGPAYTNLLDPNFAEGLAEFAGAIARRYPWLDSFTPVNEPLTTARFSALYGQWYPHAQDDRSWATALLNQCRAVVLAMQAIRREIPQARLIQTEDLGKTFSTPALQYQADFENERRWLSFDLIGGYLTRQHPMWHYLIWLGIKERELEWFSANPCPPDLFGVNYYLTSERFLDERLEHYPSSTHGGNGNHRYADLEAVRVRSTGLIGVSQLLQELWERYQRPMALTEVHNGCTREEQLRWLIQLWHAVQQLCKQGVPIEALTVWSLLGAYDWDSLVTRKADHYEPGVFDLRASQPRPTALATLVNTLATKQIPTHPVLSEPGWWQRPTRFCYGFMVKPNGELQLHSNVASPSTLDLLDTVTKPSSLPAQPVILITGATGRLSQAIAKLCYQRGLSYQLLSRQALDICESATIEKAIEKWRPWAIINAAGFEKVEAAQLSQQQCYRENTLGPLHLAAACARYGLKLITFSSDLVFDGSKTQPYLESDRPSPLSYYGQSKAEAEEKVLKHLPQALVIRSSALFSPWDTTNFVTVGLKNLANGQTVQVGTEIVSPTYLPELAQVSLDLLLDDEKGYWHLTNRGALSRFELLRQVAARSGLRNISELIKPLPCSSVRPAYSVLDSERGQLMSRLDEAIERYFQEGQAQASLLQTQQEKESFGLPC